ncbi:hypothetical protein [Citrobacter sp. RHBSTW-01013]|uniref:hypothetical protein n=1 Tax=Citrobacter sp. RHBSTW-01013 TaxID=2742677 RepID=UPI002016D467|nr:hypothetical protein [Citrobacter sp. RHBSTW-01013]
MDTNKFNHSDATNQADTISLLLTKSSDAQADVIDLIRAGVQLHFIKNSNPHGGFINRLSELGISHRVALHSMRVALKFGIANTPRAAIAKTGIGKTKLSLLARLDEVTLDLLASGGAYNDHTLDDILRISARELQQIINSGKDSSQERQLVDKPNTTPLPVDSKSPKNNEPMQSVKNEEGKKQYCRELFRVALRYSGVNELDILTKSIEELIACSLADKYCPGLNAASYEVYNKFMINRRAAK